MHDSFYYEAYVYVYVTLRVVDLKLSEYLFANVLLVGKYYNLICKILW